MALSGGYRIHVQIRVNDKLCSFGEAYECVSGTDSLTDASDLCDAWDVAILPAFKDVLASDVTFEGLYAVALLPGVAMPDSRPGISAAGNRTGDALPANSCAVITLQTNDPTAKRQGRVYVSGLSKDDVVNGLFEAAFVAGALTTFADLLADQISSGGKTFEPRIVQKVIAGVPVAGNLLPVVSTRVTNIPYTQRRRTTKQFGYGP